MLKNWFLAARPKTLLVSLAPVLTGSALACRAGKFNWIPALICLVFALLAQITSNFINDYSDFKKGTDGEDRLGPERAVATGMISPRAMLHATIFTLSLALMIGLLLVYYGGWWLIAVGAAVAVFAIAYSAGPYPLSYHGLGDVAVLLFYGIVPVVFTYYVQALDFPLEVWLASVSVGLVGVNVLIVNNYRDMETDAASGKKTTVVRFGRTAMGWVYLADCVIAYNIGFALLHFDYVWMLISLPFVAFSVMLWQKLTTQRGRILNKVLGMTSLNVLLFAVCFCLGLWICA